MPCLAARPRIAQIRGCPPPHGCHAIEWMRRNPTKQKGYFTVPSYHELGLSLHQLVSYLCTA